LAFTIRGDQPLRPGDGGNDVLSNLKSGMGLLEGHLKLMAVPATIEPKRQGEQASGDGQDQGKCADHSPGN
jgi:hypothetical protein